MASISNISVGVPQQGTSEDERAITSLLARLQQGGVPINKPQQPPLLERLSNFLNATNYASMSALQAGLRGQNPIEEGWKGLTGERKTTFRDILEKDLGIPNVQIPYFPDTNTILGTAGDILFDPLTYMSFGTTGAAKAIGKAGAKQVLTKLGEEALMRKTVTMGAKKAEESILREGSKKLFEQGGIKFMGKTVIPGATISKAASDLVGSARKVPFFGKAIDYAQTGADVMKEIVGTTWKTGYEFTKQIRELTAVQKEAAKVMGMTEKEAITAIPEISKEVQEGINWMIKDKRFAADQGFKQMVGVFGGINPEEGKLLSQSFDNIPGSIDKLSGQGKYALLSSKMLVKDVGKENLKMGLIKRLVKDYNPRYLTLEAKKYLQDNLATSNPAMRGLIKVLNPKKGKERVLITPELKEKVLEIAKNAGAKKRLDEKLKTTFFGKELKTNTITEINSITKEKLGFNWFEEDLTKALPRYYTDFVTNKALYDNLQSLPITVNKESGYQIFKPMIKGANELPGYQKFSLDALKDYQAPKFVVDQIEGTYKTLGNIKEINKFFKLYDKVLQFWKFGMTSFFPTFHTQNRIGGEFVNFQRGIIPLSPKWIKLSNEAMAIAEENPTFLNINKLIKKTNTIDINKPLKEYGGRTLKDLKILYEQYGGGQGMFHGDVGESVYSRLFKNQQPLIRKGMNSLADRAENTGAFIEDLNRLPIFLDEMAKHGDPRRAVKEVFKYHFDYSPEAYTPIEREFFSRLIPFYKFMRGNIPLQLNMLYSRTGRMSAITKVVRDLGGGEDTDKPEWLRSQFNIKLPPEVAKLLGRNPGDKVFVSLPFPFAEIGKVDPKTLLSQMTPFLKIPLELITNQQLFFGNHIWNPDLPPEAQTSKAYPILKPLTQIPGIGKGLAEVMKWREKPLMGADGKPTGNVYYEADPGLMYALKQMLGPISRAYILFGQMPDNTIAQNLSDMVLPFGIVPVNPSEAAVSNLSKRRKELSELVGYYKARGMVPEEALKQKPPLQEEAQSYLNEVIYNK